MANINQSNDLASFSLGFDDDYQSDIRKRYIDYWESLTINEICPNASINDGAYALGESVSVYQVLDLLCEGEIEGFTDANGNLIELGLDSSKNEDLFKGIYLNDLPVKNTNVNTLNYARVFADCRYGTFDQNLLAKFQNDTISFRNTYSTFSQNLSLPGLNPNNYGKLPKSITFQNARDTNGNLLTITKGGYYSDGFTKNIAVPILEEGDITQIIRSLEEAQVVKFNHIITNDNANSVQLNMSFQGFRTNRDGDKRYSTPQNFIIKVSYDDDEVMLKNNGSVVYVFCTIQVLSTSPYFRTYLLPLPPSYQGRDRKITVFRIDKELIPAEMKASKSLAVDSISEIISQNLNYPHSAIIGTVFDARAFSGIPKRTFNVKMAKIKVPSNYDPETKTYIGDWDGTFYVKNYWTDNPAWVFYDLLTNKRYGLAKYGFKKAYLDKWNLYSISRFCDELLPTGYSGLFDKLSFTIDAGGTTVYIDDSSTNLGADGLLNRFPEKSLVCLFDLNTQTDGNGTAIEQGFKRIVLNPVYDSNTAIFSFKILPEPPVKVIFSEYPDFQKTYLNDKKGLSAKDYILDTWINNQNSNEPYITNYINGSPIIATARSGKILTQLPNALPILEPRFSCNLYLDNFQSAIEAMNLIASLFRGSVFWSSGYLFASTDRKKDPIMLFNNSNVNGGAFTYAGTAKTARHTAALVRYNDAQDSYKPKAEYIEDPAGIREYGYLLKEIVGIGITSKSQAHRLGKWLLYTHQTETEIVEFTSGIEATYLIPGDIIKVQDKLKTIKRYGGRIIDINYATKSVTLDSGIGENVVGQKITLIVPKQNLTNRQLNKNAKTNIELSFSDPSIPSGIPQSEIDETRQTQIKEFTILSITSNNVINITETTDEDFNLIVKGSLWSVQNLDADYDIKEVEYRVLSVSEQSPNEYTVVATMYNSSKFDAVDFSKSLEANQDSAPQKVIIQNLPTPLTSGTPENQDIISASLTSSYYDAIFTNRESEYDTALEVSFSAVASANGVNSNNTGGYLVEVYKDGQKVRFALDGHDNTSFSVFLGNSSLYNNISYEIYRYDTSYKLENLNL